MLFFKTLYAGAKVRVAVGVKFSDTISTIARQDEIQEIPSYQ